MDVTGAVSVGVIYSDNVTLESDGFEEDDFVYRADPSIAISSIGRRYDFRLDYTLEALYYQDQPDSTQVYNQGDATLDIEVLEEHLFVNTLASISQVVVDPEQPFSFTNVPQSNNRSDATRFRIGPEWRQDILGSSLNVRYDIGQVNYDDETVQDGHYQDLNTDWTGPEKDRGLTWAVRHEYRNYDYEDSEDAKRQLAELSLIYELSGGWAPFVSAGMESDVEDRTDASLQDGIWRAGLRRETARTAFEAYAGERSFGSSWGASFQRQYSAESGDILRISYAETPSTNEELDSTLTVPGSPSGTTPPPGPAVPPTTVPPDVTAPGSGRFYLEKRGDVVLARSFNRNAVSLNLFYEDDETLSEDTPADSDNTRQTGLSLIWVYEFGARTQALLDGFYANREFSRVGAPDDDDDLFRFRLGLTYQVGVRTALSGWIAREERSGSDTESNNYTENQVGLSVGRTF
ncbi:MAG: TIGR03016 family PEP-CTERM system-associated outer membrane protein [Gammaproteobacteria bacterium]